MYKKIVFIDLDGTIIDHNNNDISKSTEQAIFELQKNGHLVVIATGRPPSLFYGIDQRLKIDTYIAANGRYVVYKGKPIYEDYMCSDSVDKFVNEMDARGIDIAFESVTDYVIHKDTSGIAEKFNNNFHIDSPKVIANFHKHNNILQMVMFTENHKIDEIMTRYPEFNFNISCRYGIDINAVGGMKDIGMKVICDYLSMSLADTIAIGDGYNDISMLEQAGFGIAMGNACDPLKNVSDLVTDTCGEDGIYKALKKIALI